MNFEDPEFEKLLAFLATKEQFVFLDTNRQDSENTESLLFLDPIARMRCAVGDDLADYMLQLQRLLDEGYYLAGWIGYEFGAIYGASVGQDGFSFPNESGILADLGVFLKPYRFRHDTGENDFPPTGDFHLSDYAYNVSNIKPNMSEREFVTALHRVREYIAAGDTYQVNYTMKLNFDFEGSPERWYQTLRRNQSVAYGAFIRNGEERILSLSPELFFRKKGNVVISRPMKGTLLRGFTTAEERQHIDFLGNDPKNRSENVMIVDLLRNDLARLMFNQQNSSVSVPSLFDVESYESLLQMTSTVRATCEAVESSRLHVTELFQALFPCGSITGAPKIRTMEIINELEKERRGVYTGAIGYMGPEGTAVFNVPIRTVHLRGNRGQMGVGAGITFDSDPQEEWQESLLKGRFLTHSALDYYLFETLLWLPGIGYLLLDEHLQRLEDSAGFFKFRFAVDRILQSLQAETVTFLLPTRVKLILYKDGRLSVNSMKCHAPKALSLPTEPKPNAEFAAGELPSFRCYCDTDDWPKGPWCYHKTSIREKYDLNFAAAQEQGLFDIVLCNERGEVTEGCITNLILYKDGQYITPPVSCGLLSGTMRRHLLERHAGVIVEAVVTRPDLEDAEAIFLCNSVRGVVQVALAS